jgi:NADPH:quinone reductase-like Zn-dependent oxidoreductase
VIESRNDVKKSPDPTKPDSLADSRVLDPRACDVTTAAAEAKAQYSAIVLGATGNVGGRIVQLLIQNPLCKKVVVVTRRKTDTVMVHNLFRRSRHAISRRVSQIRSVLGDNAGETAARLG